jgi:hypothetical protein
MRGRSQRAWNPVREIQLPGLPPESPKGVTDKIEQGDSDVQDATMHSNERMIKQVYDRRRESSAKPGR